MLLMTKDRFGVNGSDTLFALAARHDLSPGMRRQSIDDGTSGRGRLGLDGLDCVVKELSGGLVDLGKLAVVVFDGDMDRTAGKGVVEHAQAEALPEMVKLLDPSAQLLRGEERARLTFLGYE